MRTELGRERKASNTQVNWRDQSFEEVHRTDKKGWEGAGRVEHLA